MLVRSVLFSLAAAGLAGSAAALEATPGPAPATASAAAPKARALRLVRIPLPPQRPLDGEDESAAVAALASAPPAASVPPVAAVAAPAAQPTAPEPEPPPARSGRRLQPEIAGRSSLATLIAAHARANHVPEDLVHRIVMRESRYNPRAVGRGGALGLMQIKHPTARALGYAGPPNGLLDANTNLTYGVRYLAGAYRVANGNYDRAVGYYARGYYYDAKRRGMLGAIARGPNGVEIETGPAQPKPSIFSVFAEQVSPPARASESAR